MDATTKILVKNTSIHPINISLPDTKFKRTWTPGGEFKVPFEVLQEAIYDRGFMVFIERGLLFIDDKAARVELGLEEEDAEPVVKILTKAQLTKLLKVTPVDEFAVTVREITPEQCKTLIDIALEAKNVDMRKAAILKEITGIDTIKAIELKNLNEEPEKTDK